MRRIAGSIVAAVLLAAAPPLAVAGQDDRPQPPDILLPGWMLRETEFDGSRWSASGFPAGADDDARGEHVFVEPVRDDDHREPVDMQLDVPGIGRVAVSVRLFLAGHGDEAEPHVEVDYIHERNGLRIGSEQWSGAQAPVPPMPDGPERDALRRATLDAAGRSPRLAVIRALLAQPLKLGVYDRIDGPPAISAAIDDGPFTPLAADPDAPADAYNPPRRLAARPGQRVRLRIHQPSRRFTVTNAAITSVALPGAPRLPGAITHGGSFTLDEKDDAIVDLGPLPDPRRIELSMDDGDHSSSAASTLIFVRYGRPVERWLGNRVFPLSTIAPDASDEAVLAALVKDLESAYDPDYMQYANRRGDWTFVHRFEMYAEWAALRSLRLPEGFQIASLLAESDPQRRASNFAGDDAPWRSAVLMRLREGFTPTDLAAAIIDAAVKGGGHPIFREDHPQFLWQPPRPWEWRDAEVKPTTTWHSTRFVHALAAADERFPDLRPTNPLRRVLAFWVDAMPAQPDPGVLHRYKGGVGDRPSTDPIERLYAIAALDRGHRIYGDKRYLAARDAQFRRMVELLKADGSLDAIRERKLWGNPTPNKLDPSSKHAPICSAIVAYGQACIVVGDAEGLAACRDWVRAALSRRGDDAGPFGNYAVATFADRCGMIGLMLGRATLITPPWDMPAP